MPLARLQKSKRFGDSTRSMEETKHEFDARHHEVSSDPLALFLSEAEIATVSSAPAVMTVSSTPDLPDEWQVFGARPGTAVQALPTVPVDDHGPEEIKPVASRARTMTKRRIVHTLPSSTRWLTFLALLVSSLVMLVALRPPVHSTTAPMDAVHDVSLGGSLRPAGSARDVQLFVPPSPVSPPPVTNDAVVTSASKQPTSSRLPALQQLDAAQMQPRMTVQSADGISVNVIRPGRKAMKPLTTFPARETASQVPAFVGAVAVDSEPTGAAVFIDGESVGVTPLVNWELRAGSHVVRVEVDGYERWSTAIQVVTQKTVNLVATLQPIRRPW
jgi:PEGA domain